MNQRDGQAWAQDGIGANDTSVLCYGGDGEVARGRGGPYRFGRSSAKHGHRDSFEKSLMFGVDRSGQADGTGTRLSKWQEG